MAVNSSGLRMRSGRLGAVVGVPSHVMETNTRRGYEYTLRKYLVLEFALMRMNEIAPIHVRSFLASLGTQRRLGTHP